MLGWVESDMGIISAREEVQLKIEYQGQEMGLNLIKNRCLIRRERAFPWFKMINYTKAKGKG